MVRRTTLILFALFVLVAVAALVLRDRGANEGATPTPTESSTLLFDAALGDPTMVRVESPAGGKVQFEQSAAGPWVLIAPEAAEAAQAAAQAAATQLGALRILTTVHLSPDVIGLDMPDYTITVAFGASETHVLRVGSVTPINNGYYAQLDKGPYQVVDKYGLDVLIGLLAAPPYLHTPTPQPTVTPLASPTPAATLTTSTGEATSAAANAGMAPQPTGTP